MKRKSTRRIIAIIAVIILGFAAATILPTQVAQYTNSDTATGTPMTAAFNQIKDEVKDIMNRPDFKKKMEVEAETIYWQEEKAKATADYEAKMKNIEAELEALRGQEVSF